MKKASVVVCLALALASVPGFAQTQSPAPFNLAAIFSPAATGSCSARPASQNGANLPGPVANATCIADCGMYGPLTCTFSSSCSAVDRECPKRGSVTCDGVTYNCPTCATADYCYQCQQDPNDCVSCCVCAGDTVVFCRAAC